MQANVCFFGASISPIEGYSEERTPSGPATWLSAMVRVATRPAEREEPPTIRYRRGELVRPKPGMHDEWNWAGTPFFFISKSNCRSQSTELVQMLGNSAELGIDKPAASQLHRDADVPQHATK